MTALIALAFAAGLGTGVFLSLAGIFVLAVLTYRDLAAAAVA